LARPYSYRFIGTTAHGLWVQYTVPVAKRAVVKSISLCNTGSGTGNVWLRIAGITVFGWASPGALATKNEPMSQVVYAGEMIELYLATLYFEACVSGYLLDDIGPAPPLEDEITYERFEVPTPLAA
jgi:hypothetical protein